MIRLTAITAAALAMVSTAAFADGMAKKSLKDAPLAAAGYSWAGCYAGGNVGYGWSSVTNTGTPYLEGEDVSRYSGSVDASPKGVLGGVQAGCNWQRNRFVFGVETDLDLTSMDGDGDFARTATFLSGSLDEGDTGFGPTTGTFTQKLAYFGTLRGRLGVTVSDRVLLFATGGLAYGRVESTTVVNAASFVAFHGSDAVTKFGWTVGGGGEYALNDRWSLKGEYLYFKLGSTGHTAGSPIGLLPVGINHDQNGLHGNIVRMGLNYRF